MSAEVLREAARAMRKQAKAARASLSDNVPEWHSVQALMGEGKTEGDAEHIASWHPAVALAVADWLDTAGADLWAHGPLCECGTGCDACDDNVWEPHVRDALVVARAYLGSTS